MAMLCPCFALGTSQPAADRRPIAWGLYQLFHAAGLHVQAFRDSATLSSQDAPFAVAGNATRHLDSWVMSRDVCRRLYRHATRTCDLATIEGQFDLREPERTEEAVPRNASFDGLAYTDCAADYRPLGAACYPPAAPLRTSSLNRLCQWLAVPRVHILDVSQWGPCRILPRPERVSAVMLDRVRDADDFFRWQTILEATWGVPVLGGIDHAPALRAVMATLPAGARPPAQLCELFARRMQPLMNLPGLLKLAGLRGHRSPETIAAPLGEEYERPSPVCSFAAHSHSCPESLVVAIAFDEAFDCYFPDTLDWLESSGAIVKVFSPLHDERLPECDAVYFGCGHPERYLRRLTENQCLWQSLRSFAARGGRVYGEGAGLAVLGERLISGNGRAWTMSGLLPIESRLRSKPLPLHPVELFANTESWLYSRGDCLRGYRNGYWDVRLSANGRHAEHAAPDLIAEGNVIGSRLHLHFAGYPRLLERFLARFEPVLL